MLKSVFYKLAPIFIIDNKIRHFSFYMQEQNRRFVVLAGAKGSNRIALNTALIR